MQGVKKKKILIFERGFPDEFHIVHSEECVDD
jgi:hypothetical protein